MSLTFEEMKTFLMKQAAEKAFGTNENVNVPEKIALIHSEISEAYEAYRHKNLDGEHGFQEELGDALARILHLCGCLNIDIEKELLKKVEKNKERKWNWKEMNEDRE